MWLINTTTLELESFQECPTNTYAILSHTWGLEAEEPNFDEFKLGEGRQKIGFRKIQKCCEQAQKDGLQYAWADTCCIDKRSSSELSEAINSMFSWYARAKICYVYLADVRHEDLLHSQAQSFSHSRWFTRGWTLQELIASPAVSFYTVDWAWIGDKPGLAHDLYTITGVDHRVLTSEKSYLDCSIAQRMSWASRRETTRLEDSAYCLIGLFNVNIPLLYGEGSKAFWRLEQEIIKQTDDETIFAWTGVAEGGSGLLAPSPANFINSASIQQDKQHGERPPYQATNRGLSMECQMLPCEMNTYVVPLRCGKGQESLNSRPIVIFLCRTSEDQQYRRVSFQDKCIDEAIGWDISKAKTERIFVPDEGRTLELSPHAGLPLVRVESNLEAWQFPRIGPGAHQSSQVDSVSMVASDLENGGIQLEETGISSSESTGWMPKKVTEVSFQSQCRDLEKGVVIALKSPAAGENNFRYYLEIGFDIDFTPVCILHIRQFRLISRAGFWCEILLLWDYLPLRDSFWSQKVDKSYRRETLKLGDAGVRVWPPFIEWSQWTLRNTYEAFELLSYHGHRYLRGVKGDRITGLEICINDMLPRDYGCMNLNLSFRHLHDLDWQLTIQEEHLHPESYRDGVFCFRRLFITGRKISMVLVRLTAFLFFFFGLLGGMVSSVSLAIGVWWTAGLFHISIFQAMGFNMFIILTPAIFALIFPIFRPKFRTGRKFGLNNHTYHFTGCSDTCSCTE